MPKLDFPHVTKTIQLSEYTPEFGETQINVWVNVPRDVITQMHSFQTMKNAEMFAWLMRVWGDTWKVEELDALFTYCIENDPAFWGWLIDRTVTLVLDYRNGIKKA